ncbi:MAG TPA: hypothetical protein VK509_15935 [Polyangiales bacterium]|nr:hypothetical protein [Polyangiales bacterium]
MLKTLSNAMAVVIMALTLTWSTSAGALAPSDLWSVSNASGGMFSADGSSVLLTVPTGFQLRRATDGRLEKTIALPAASRGYDAFAFSPNKRYVALTYRLSGVTRIELFSVATGALARTINTGAVRNARGIQLSSTGLVALFERYAYGGGGQVWTYRVSDGGLVNVQPRSTRSSTTVLDFSPDGSRLAINDSAVVGQEGVRVVRTSDWTTELLVRSAWPFRWAADSRSLWTSRSPFDADLPLWEEVELPSGEVLSSTAIDPARYFPSDVTPDNRFFLANTPANDALVFLRTTDAGAALTFSAPARSWAGRINPAGSSFIYTVCSDTACSAHVARMPSL